MRAIYQNVGQESLSHSLLQSALLFSSHKIIIIIIILADEKINKYTYDFALTTKKSKNGELLITTAGRSTCRIARCHIVFFTGEGMSEGTRAQYSREVSNTGKKHFISEIMHFSFRRCCFLGVVETKRQSRCNK